MSCYIILSTLRATFLTPSECCTVCTSCRSTGGEGLLHILTKCLPPYGNAIWLMYLIIYYPGVLLPLKFLDAECGWVYRRTEILSYALYFANIFCICILYTKIHNEHNEKCIYRVSNALTHELTRILGLIRRAWFICKYSMSTVD